MGNRYIYNQHIAPITVNARDLKGRVLFTRTFRPERIDGTTGRVVSTGYTTLTDEEYDQLCESSRTFVHYKDKLKLLSVHEDLPPEAKTPQEALADARNEARKAARQTAELNDEIVKLKAALEDTAAERDAAVTELKAVKKVLAEKLADKSDKSGKGKEFS